MRIKTLSLLLALSLGHALPAIAAEPVAASQSQLQAYTSVEGITEYRLPNGLRVLLAPDASKPTTTVNITYLVGSRHESYGETGMAHLLEHMLFKGTPTSGNLMQELGKRGMQFNGTTFLDRTNYYETFPANDDNLRWALEMEADRMVNSKIARSDLDTEFSVVRNEMEMGENNPRRVLWKQMTAVSYDWHNYGHNTIGARSDVEKVRIDNLQAFYRKYYQPDNAVLMISGKFDPAATLDVVRQTFGKIAKPQRQLTPTWTEEPQRDGARELTVERVGDTQLAAVLYPISAGSHPDAAAILVLADILASTPNGRLYQALVGGKKAVGVEAWPFALAEPGYIIFWAELNKGQKLADTRQAMLAAIEGFKNKPVTEAELKRAKASLLNDIDKTLNDPQQLAVEMSEAIAKGDWRLFFLTRDRIEALSAKDVERAAENYFKPSNRTYGQFVPTAKPDRSVIPATPDVAKLVDGYKGRAAISQGEAFDPSPANIDARTVKTTLANGAKLALLAKKTRGETVNGSFSLAFGDEKSLFGLGTVPSLAADMLERGSGKLSRAEISNRLDQLKAKLSISGSGQEVNVDFETTRTHLPALLDLIADLLKQPSFPEREFELLRKEGLTAIDAQRNEPQAMATQAVGQALNIYRKGDLRYRPTLDEAAAELKTAKLDDLKRFHRQFYGANHARFALVGDFDAKAAQSQLQKLFGGWNSPVTYSRAPSLLPPAKPGQQQLQAKDKANAFYLATAPLAMRDSDADYPAMLVANKILGGGVKSRLLDRLRQKDGISYYAGSQFKAGSFEPVASLSLVAIYAPQNLEKLKQGVTEELTRFIRDGVNATELADAKKALQQEREIARAQDGALSGALDGQLQIGRGMEFNAKVDAAIAALTVEQVNAALRKHINPAQLLQVYAGDFKRP
ncbi:M16 family metallopeptidase [Chromobacterium haemolyticum]|uniref:M16 family metallopeptidase n=1 Tax=Chromobacterium haemolyticum TaxID=394935 RepID=UPI000DF007B2|nr:pitrilysin family protein [Chromobacterium haemolyticum]